MSVVLELFSAGEFWASALIAAAPMLLGILGAALCGRAGIIQFGAEGLFIAGALIALLVAYAGGGPWTGLIAGIGMGCVLGAGQGLLMAATSALGTARLPQAVAGLGASVVLAALAQCIFTLRFGDSAAMPTVVSFDLVIWPSWVARIPYLGQFAAAVQVSAPALIALICAATIGYLFSRTPLGLTLIVCGDNPEVIAAQGRSVESFRIAALATGSAFISAAGAVFVLTVTSSFTFGQLNGRGFAAVALAMIAGYRISGAILAALLFGVVDTLEWRLQAAEGGGFGVVLSVVPLALVLLLVAAAGGRRNRPLARERNPESEAP